ncbi:outer membrane beta-barrel protein [Helicobacter suis]|uniref:outer membrane beta-barrel protein n=1 Tax=Helicobacter suis TaxID=104628 RepID=UPI000CF0967A|nr:outer membrane beta-barrel protein [Helicobacter suis]
MISRLAFLFFLLFSFIQAHPYSSYLDGPFLSFSMGGGPGDIMQSSNASSINTQAQQAYQAEISAYDKAISSLQDNKEQTITQLKKLAEQLQEANPSSVALDHLVDKLDALAKNPDVKNLLASVNSSLSAYQQYLNNTINSYNKENQQLINSAQQALKHDQTQINQANAQNLKTLKQAISTFKSLNSAIEQISKDLGISYTPLSLPPPLNTDISSLTPSEVYQALLTLSGDINKMVGLFSSDENTLSQDDQKIAVENANKLSALNATKNADITQAMNSITGVTEILGRAFHNQWINYADGHTFFLTNGQHSSYLTAGDLCVFNIIFSNGLSGANGCGYQENAWNQTPTTTNSTRTLYNDYEQALKKDGYTNAQIWGTLFNLQELEHKFTIYPSDCDHANVGCVANKQNFQKFFNLMNNYVGAADFAGNFKNSSMYTTLLGDLQSGSSLAVSNFLNAYTHVFATDMIDFFVLNPIWIMSVVSGSHKPPQTPPTPAQAAKDTRYGDNVTYCYRSPTVGLSFSEGYRVCGYNSWANAIFVGYFGFLTNQVSDVLHDVLETAYGPTGSSTSPSSDSAQASINTAQSAYDNWKNFTPQQIFPLQSMPNIPTLTPTTPSDIIPISTNAANLPQVQKPQAPLITFSTKDLRQNSLRIGLFTTAGYQKYFNSFVGMSYYGYAGYRYLYMGTQSSIDNLNRYQLGVGSNLLFNVYSKISVPKMGLPRIGHVQVRAYGLFAGLLGVVNFWNANYFGGSLMRYDLNIDITVGISARFNRFKWSLGAHIPLVNQTRSLDPDGSLKLIDSYRSTGIFMGFTIFPML